jgi:penicillin-binding protein 1A
MSSQTPPHDSDAEVGARHSETAAAGRALIDAVRHDLSKLWAKLRIPKPARSRRSRSRTGEYAPGTTWKIVKGAVLVAIVGALVFSGTMLWVLRDLPLDGLPPGRERAILLEAADGSPLGRVGPLKVSNATRDEFPEQVVNAVLSIEDRRFYRHWGVDLVGIARAIRANYASGSLVQGGSTITQQLVKLRIVGNERSFARKLREAFAALWLEMRIGKDEILTRYLNSVYMGAGAQGIPAAAELYFSKHPRDLTLPEAAMLAGMIKAPSRFNPLQNLPGAQARAAVVLQAMVDDGKLDAQVAREAIAHPASLNTPAIASEAGTWFSDWVAREAQDVTGSLGGTIRVRTTLVPGLQKAAEQAVNEALRDGARQRISQAALVAMRPDGAVVAMVGGRNYAESQFNRVAQARRQPGSAFKLFVYMAALQSGYAPGDTIDASPVNIAGWEPQNYGGASFGTVTLAEAFARSVNTAAVRLATNVGIDKVIAAARALGIEGPLPAVPSLALGSADVSLLNLTAAYAGVMAGRAPIHPWGVGSLASEEKPRLVSIGAPSSAQKPMGEVRDKLIELLRLPIERGTATAASIDGFAAGKTGTTQDYRDAWFIGFTDKLAVGVWVGNDDRAPMDGVTGGAAPALIWKSFIEQSGKAPAEQAPVTDAPMAEAPPQARVEQQACDYRACAAKYQSFDAAACTYQPYGGGARQKCTEGASEVQQTALAGTNPDAEKTRCDVAACAASYSSFRAADCTYQPLDGGARRVCEKGRSASSTKEPAPRRSRAEDAGPRRSPPDDRGDGDADYPPDEAPPTLFGRLLGGRPFNSPP